MSALEQKAISLGAKEVTLNTLCGIAGKTTELWESIGVTYDPSTRLNEFWYERLGYKAYKREPRYKEKAPSGETVLLPAVVSSCPLSLSRHATSWLTSNFRNIFQFMRKPLRTA
jgi:hypothetical protein